MDDGAERPRVHCFYRNFPRKYDAFDLGEILVIFF
jgi:hypothetical protein